MSDFNKKSPPDWDAEVAKARQENVVDVLRQVRDEESGMMKKITTYCMKFGFDRRDVIDKINNDNMFAVHFAKDPGKQGIHERIAADYLKQLSHVNNFEILPKSGKKSLFFNNAGELLKCRNKKSETSKQDSSTQNSKSLDFFWGTDEFVCYASHKHTKEQGGGQDFQFGDQKRFLENFIKHDNKKAIFFAICDGEYYNDHRMQELEALTRKTLPLSFAVPIENVEEELRAIVALKDND